MNVTFSTFDEWLGHVFGPPESKAAWYWDVNAPYWDSGADPHQAVEFLTTLFSNPSILIGRYSASQIGVGIEYLISPSASDHAFALLNNRVPIERRLACLRHIATLYSELFACICPVHYGHMDDGPEPLNGASAVCYMFWDVFPMFDRTKNDLVRDDADVRNHLHEHVAIEDACLIAMDRTLLLDHPACQEGALHGLGHWAHGYSERVDRIINEFLKRDITDEIRQYASNARTGCIL